MTEMPSEVLGSDDPADDDPDLDDGDLTWGHPGTLALLSLFLAYFSFVGARLINGSTYTWAFVTQHESSNPVFGTNTPLNDHSWQIAGVFITAVVALVPLFVAKAGLSRLVPSDSPWIGHVLRVALVVASVSFALHLLEAVIYVSAVAGNGNNPLLPTLLV